MSSVSDGSFLGLCPLCNSRIPAERLIVNYTPAEGWPRMLAECGTCEEVVGPV